MSDRLPYISYVTLYQEDEDTVRARYDAWANEGRDPADTANWTDTRNGAFFQLLTEGGVREDARIYDRLSEVVAMSLPLYAAGTYLDDIAESRGLERLDATTATGVATFGGPNGTPIPSGTSVSPPLLTADDDPPSFVTTAPVTIASGSIDAPIVAVSGGVSGNLSAGAITVMNTPIAGVTVSNADETSGGSDPEADDVLATRILRQFRTSGTANYARYEGWALGWPGVSRVTVLPHGLGAGTVLIIITGPNDTPAGSVVIDGLQDFLDPPHYRDTLDGAQTLPEGTVTVHSTAGTHPATITDPGFIRIGDQAVEYTGSTGTTFTGCTGGTGSFPDGAEVTQSGDGHGIAPIGHHVFVRTAALLTEAVTATVVLEQGYSLDGDDSTVATRIPMTNALTAYFATVPSGGELVFEQVKAVLARTTGVHDVTAATLGGGTANIPVGAAPAAQIPVLGTFTPTT